MTPSGQDDSRGLPAYTVRRSPRARHVRITVSPRHGVVVTVPAGMRGFDADSLVRERRAWIEEVSSHFAEQRAQWLADPAELLPDSVHLLATGEEWPVVYRNTGASTVRIVRSGSELIVSGGTHDAGDCLAALQRWVSSSARDRLLPWMDAVSHAHALTPAKVTIRAQHGRWGGCSSRGAITLNRALLFLPASLVEGVMLHELAHLAHPNHSQRFWGHLATLDPDWAERRAAIREAWRFVPGWAERRIGSR